MLQTSLISFSFALGALVGYIFLCANRCGRCTGIMHQHISLSCECNSYCVLTAAEHQNSIYATVYTYIYSTFKMLIHILKVVWLTGMYSGVNAWRDKIYRERVRENNRVPSVKILFGFSFVTI